MFQLNSDITIGVFTGLKPHEVKVTKSVYTFIETATLKVPMRARIIDADGKPGAILQTSNVIGEGMKVIIKLGYNGRMEKEFEGFVNRVNFTSPLQIECEGYSYQLKQQSYMHSFKKTTVKEILQYLISGTDIVLDKDIIDVPIDKFILSGESGTEALVMLKRVLFDTISFRFVGNVLLAESFPVKADKGEVVYQIGYNVIKGNELKKREASNADVEVNMIGIVKDGTTVKVQTKSGKTVTKDKVNITSATSGITGEKKIYKTHAISDKNALQTLSDSKHNKLSFDGYEGKITTFLQPYCQCGYKAILYDNTYPERNGDYIINSVEVTYGMSGARRIVGIGMKLN